LCAAVLLCRQTLREGAESAAAQQRAHAARNAELTAALATSMAQAAAQAADADATSESGGKAEAEAAAAVAAAVALRAQLDELCAETELLAVHAASCEAELEGAREQLVAARAGEAAAVAEAGATKRFVRQMVQKHSKPAAGK